MGTREEIESILETPLPEHQQNSVQEEIVTDETIPAPQATPPSIPAEKPVAELTEEEIQDRAMEYGWNPDYNGANKKSAKEFLEVAEKRAPLLLKDKRRLEQENEILKKQNLKMMENSAETIKKLQSDADKRIAELEVKKKEAKENLDTEALESAINEQNDIKQEKQKLSQQATPVDPTVEFWARENKDFVTKVESDKVLSNYADAVALDMRDDLMKLPPAERFEKVKQRVMEELPHKFANPNQQQAPRTLTMNRTATPQRPNESKVSISNLPADEKAAYDLIVKAQRFKTTEEKKAFDDRYLENYKIMNGQK